MHQPSGVVYVQGPSVEHLMYGAAQIGRYIPFVRWVFSFDRVSSGDGFVTLTQLKTAKRLFGQQCFIRLVGDDFTKTLTPTNLDVLSKGSGGIISFDPVKPPFETAITHVEAIPVSDPHDLTGIDLEHGNVWVNHTMDLNLIDRVLRQCAEKVV